MFTALNQHSRQFKNINDKQGNNSISNNINNKWTSYNFSINNDLICRNVNPNLYLSII